VRQLEEQDAEHITDVMRGFLRSVSGCSFASSAARTAGSDLIFGVMSGDTVDAPSFLNPFLDEAAAQRVAVVVCFPELRTPLDVVQLLGNLARDDRWQLRIAPRKKHPHDDALASLFWTTPANDRSSVMGLAPMAEMPVTRRAPYVSLALWPGTRNNPYKSSKDGEVGFIDMNTSMDKAAFDVAWDKTRQTVRARCAYPADGAARPDVAFSLPVAMQRELEALAV
jgi:hypothetical protein